MPVPTFYLDNMIVCGLIRKDLVPGEQAASETLRKAKDIGKVRIVTSRWSKREIEKTRKPILREMLSDGLEDFELLLKDHVVLGFHTSTDRLGGYTTCPLVSDISDQEAFSFVRNAGIHQVDSNHLEVAIHNKCDFFVTTDPVIIQHRATIEAKFPLQIVTPAEAVRHIPP
jgi:hypothetical protein